MNHKPLSNYYVDTISNMLVGIIDDRKKEGFKGKYLLEETIIEFKRRLQYLTFGLRENTCIHCMGSGYANKNN